MTATHTLPTVGGDANVWGTKLNNYLDAVKQGINVKEYGALGDGSTDDTSAIQGAIDAITAGDTLFFPTGTYILSDQVDITSKTDFVIASGGATIKAVSGMSVAGGKQLLYFDRCDRFSVKNLIVDGNRANRTPTGATPAHNIQFIECTAFLCEQITSNNSVIDGFYLSATDNTDTSTYCTDFQFINCFANNCYRQGMSIINGYDGAVRGGAYTNTNGTSPQAGIDIESNTGATVGNSRILIDGVRFEDNSGFGIVVTSQFGAFGFIVQNCYFSANTLGGAQIVAPGTHVLYNQFENHVAAGITQGVLTFSTNAGNTSSSAIGNVFTGNTTSISNDCIHVHGNVDNIRIINNKILDHTTGYGIDIGGDNAYVAGNVIMSTGNTGILCAGNDALITGNYINAATSRGIYALTGVRARITDNVVRDIASVSGAFIQCDQVNSRVSGNRCLSTNPSAEFAIRISSVATTSSVYDNHAVNLNTTDSYTFPSGNLADHLFYDNIGGSNNTFRRTRNVVDTILALGDNATPTVLLGTKFKTGGTTTITDFDDGVEGQVITVIAEHSLTITDGTNIFLSGSANWAMTATDTLTLIQKADGKWYEVSRGDNGA